MKTKSFKSFKILSVGIFDHTCLDCGGRINVFGEGHTTACTL